VWRWISEFENAMFNHKFRVYWIWVEAVYMLQTDSRSRAVNIGQNLGLTAECSGY